MREAIQQLEKTAAHPFEKMPAQQLEETSAQKLKELLPRLKGKIHCADYDIIKEFPENFKRLSDRCEGYNFRETTLDILNGIVDSIPLYRKDLESRNLMLQAIGIIRNYKP